MRSPTWSGSLWPPSRTIGPRPHPSTAPPNEEWLTLAEVAAWLKVGRTTVYRLITSGAVPSYRVGRSVRVRRADVEGWLEETRQDFRG